MSAKLSPLSSVSDTACVSMSLASPLLYFQVLWACPSPSHLDSWRKPPVSGSSLSEAPSIVSVGLPATSYCRLLWWPLCRTLTVSRASVWASERGTRLFLQLLHDFLDSLAPLISSLESSPHGSGEGKRERESEGGQGGMRELWQPWWRYSMSEKKGRDEKLWGR